MRRLSLTILAAAALTACSDPNATEPADAPAASTLPPGRPAVYEAATQGPEPFVRAIYAMYQAGATGEAPPPGRDPMLGRTLNAAIGADFRQNQGQVPFLNHDLICGCQDGALVLTSVAVAQNGAAEADANVAFTLDGEARTRTLKLVKEGQSWKVADVVEPDDGPLLDRIIATLE